MMKGNVLTPRGGLGQELERALCAWMAASRRAWEPTRKPDDLQAENDAWCRLKSALTHADVAAAA